jgi:AcrR family transcriptional regulator
MAVAGAPASRGQLMSALVPEALDKPDSIPAEIFDAALAVFLSGRRLDMRALAQHLGIGRATLYRKVGDRDRLLGEVLWWLTRHAIARALEAARRRRGRSRVLRVVEHLLRDINGQPALRRLLDAEPEAALRILTSKHGRVQAGLVDALDHLLRREEQGGERFGLDPHTLAYTIVRIGGSFLYADVIADSEPDIDQAMTVITRLLSAG